MTASKHLSCLAGDWASQSGGLSHPTWALRHSVTECSMQISCAKISLCLSRHLNFTAWSTGLEHEVPYSCQPAAADLHFTHFTKKYHTVAAQRLHHTCKRFCATQRYGHNHQAVIACGTHGMACWQSPHHAELGCLSHKLLGMQRP
jgi:hypothetical protein